MSEQEADFGQTLEAMLASAHSRQVSPAVIVVDHGSRREESNQLLLVVAENFQRATGLKIVEPAHMELAEPSIRTAFDRAVQQGAELIIVFPYFLSPGRHWHQDIPQLAAEACQRHPGTRFLVTAPLGLHSLMLQVIQDRIAECVREASHDSHSFDVCDDQGGYSFDQDTADDEK